MAGIINDHSVAPKSQHFARHSALIHRTQNYLMRNVRIFRVRRIC